MESRTRPESFQCSGRRNNPEEERKQRPPKRVKPVQCNGDGVLFRTIPVEKYSSSTKDLISMRTEPQAETN
ncbi:hypothetical protein EVAR_32755_1 [Eumeta japonica]|uniref:Uncharacterized protein n=1 Tax=Eumeta variegata TaxID=151549 RepID=A0A4C1XQT0_EUMVA|nr:hypothetical protein EVAR_32755_1 [Eumeta japonica]